MHCELCGKTSIITKKVAHDRMYVNGRSSRKIKPNLHPMKVATTSGEKRMMVCTQCMRTMKKQASR